MTRQTTKIIATFLLLGMTLGLTTTQVLAESQTEEILRIQRRQIRELQLQQQVLDNQRLIERLQERQVPQERRGPSIIEGIIGRVISEGYVNCDYRYGCGYGVENYSRGYRGWGRY